MKKTISALLVAIICVTSLTPVFADESSTVSNLILDMKALFSISDDEFVFVNYSKSDYTDNVTYNLNWESRADDTYSRKPYITIEVEADGDVVYYRKGYTTYLTPALPKFTDDEAIAKAREYIELIAPDRAQYISKGKLLGNSQYTVEFERIANGIPVAGNNITINMNPEDLSLITYDAIWSEIEFPSIDKSIDRDTAIKAYIEKLGYEVVYNITTEHNEIKEIYTSYVPKASNAYIDPFTGEATVRSEIVYNLMMDTSKDMIAAEEASAGLSPEEIQMVEEIKQMITKGDAEKLTRSIPEFNLREDAAVESFRISKNRFGDYTAYITFRADVKDGYYFVHLSFNAKTKEIISFGKSSNYDSDAPKYDADKAQEKALAFAEKYYSDKLAKTKPAFTIGEDDKYSLALDRYENGIRVEGNSITVRVNEYTGEIVNVNCVWADVEFPTPDIKVTNEEIYDMLLTEDNFRLQYNVMGTYSYDAATGKETRGTIAYPLYAVTKSPIFSTNELREIDYNGKPVAEKFKGYADTEGHYCHEAAMALGEIDVYFEGENLMPDKAVTQKEFLDLMYMTINGWRNDNVYKALIRDGVMTEDEIADNITRMDAIRFTINAMGYKEVAELDGIYNCPFTDVSEDMKGYATIAGAFGLVNASTDTLRADAPLTRAECIMILYNYLQR